ncbi:MAG: hypothetical protein GY953_51875 [bacterium]|nr:hypothetical protein [bacterium]
MVPDSYVFLDHLKGKAGLPAWPLEPDVRAFRFEAIKFLEAAASDSRREMIAI